MVGTKPTEAWPARQERTPAIEGVVIMIRG